MAKILILGGGFAGLIAAKRLALSLDKSHEVTLVSPNTNFTFYPALVHLAFGECTVDDISFDLAASLKELGVRFVRGEVIRINPARRKVEIAGNDFDGELGYDYLVLAMGRRLATEKVPGFFEHAQHLLGVKAALKFGELVSAFRDGKIVVGMCPDGRLPVPVCETAFALARKFETEMNNGKIRVSVIFPGSLADAFGGANLHKELESAFERHNISVHYDVPISEISFNEVLSSKKHKIECDLLMLVPPFRGQGMLRGLGITDGEDFVRVDGLMRVHGLERTYAIGDIVAFSGPKFAHMAVGQAEVAAENIFAEISGEKPCTEYYHEIAAIIDAGGPDSIYLHYGVWDDSLYQLKKGRFWSWAKDSHDAFWRMRNK
ncbi:MAG: FAD-dependent oxidoreductase [Acidobacteria bacterium]|nr:FAD-dependent oxidoreductase [Acidobacteriota bacterium]